MASNLPTLRCRTETFAGYGVCWSPFFPGRLAVASSQNFGLVGNGRLHLLSSLGQGGLSVEKFFDTQDGLYDVAWSEVNENQLASVSGDGTVKLWDVTLNDFPIKSWHEHQREVYSVDWNNIRKDLFATASWDNTVKVWSPERPKSIVTIPAHTACVYRAAWSPHNGDVVASCSTDCHLNVFDLKASNTSPALSIFAHPTEVLSLDWNKYHSHLVATSSVDRTIRIHDLRMSSQSNSDRSTVVSSLLGHEYAVRNVAFSPHSADTLASASYDMTCRIWSLSNMGAVQPPVTSESIKWGPTGAGGGSIRRIYDLHTEFVVGLSWNLFEEGVVATTSWDTETHVWRI